MSFYLLKSNLYSAKLHLLDRVSSCIQSPSTLSSNKLFFSCVLHGNVADLFDEDKPFELKANKKYDLTKEIFF
jgi:hypothetical protein